MPLIGKDVAVEWAIAEAKGERAIAATKDLPIVAAVRLGRAERFETLVEEIDRLQGELTDRNIDLTDRELDVQNLKADHAKLIEALKQVHDLKKCLDPECSLCGIIWCPQHEPLHYHHDGCPSCDALEPAPTDGVSSWLQ